MMKKGMVHIALPQWQLWPDEVVCYPKTVTQAQPYQERTYVPRSALENLAAYVGELEDELYGLRLELASRTEGE